jgi:Domain of unknown function (DUF4253)
VLWATRELQDAGSIWLALRDRLTGTALIPLLLSGLPGQPERPWDSGELSPRHRSILDGMDAAAVLREMWDDHVPVPEEDDAETAELLAPYSRSFPGMAPPTDRPIGPDELSNTVYSLQEPMRPGLVAADRPADALLGVGWRGGAANYHGTPAPLTVVLRSWEDRFGARLMHLGFDTMQLLMERPVSSRQAALAVAAEHFAFCMDNICQGAGSIRDYAADLVGNATWSFWWD